MSDRLLPAVITGPDEPVYSVIWMHGLGADGHDFEPIVDELVFANKNKTRFIFPHAPKQPVTVNGGYVMPAWYDIFGIAKGVREDEAGIRASANKIAKLIEHEIFVGVKAEHIVVAGFSQGGALALHTGLRFPVRLAGILALSTYLPLADTLVAERSAENRDINIMMMHGDFDQVVPLELALFSKQKLFECGWSPSWITYPMEHAVCPQQIDDIGQWFNKVLV